MRGIGGVGASLLLSLAGPAGAAAVQLDPAQKELIRLKETPPPLAAPQTDDIVVKAGPPPKVSEVTKQARAITRGDDLTHEPMPRFQYGICPGVMGLPREIAELVVDRLRYNAERTGVPVDKDGCAPNIFVAVTRDARATLQLLLQKRGYLFSEMMGDDRRVLENEGGPVRAWTYLERRGRHGESFAGAMDVGGVRVPMLQEPAAHSKIYLTTRLEIRSAVLLIDVAAIDGLTVNQIADYVAMRTFVDTREPKGEPVAGTILTLFSPDGPRPDELTSFDLAYIKSAYGSEANLPAYGKLVTAAREVRDAAPRRDQSRPGTE